MAAAVAGAGGGDPRARSLALAEARGYGSVCPPGRTVGVVVDAEEGRLITLTLAIPSATSGRVYGVIYHAPQDHATCACAAGQHARPCWHTGVALRSGRWLAGVYARRDWEA